MKVNDLNEAERYHVGTTIAGRYRVELPIGEGHMGVVALARHVSLDEKVAIKFLRPELRGDPVAIARLSREAKVLARIKSDHVTRVLDVGVTLAVGPYMVMEYLEGVDLGQVLETEGRLPVERAVEVALQVCEALTVAHTGGITHRDIKPQNLFLARHGQFETVKVLHFGIVGDEPPALQQARPLVARHQAPPLHGTPSYMSPESIRNDALPDHRSDIWSVGVVLHELVTGRRVFDAPTLIETCARVLSDASLALEGDATVLPPALRDIIARCLEREPERRYQSVEELASALAPLGTMRERFRGRSTGAFSRKLVEEQIAHSKTQRLQLPGASSATPPHGEPSKVLIDIGSALRSAIRAISIAHVYDRPVWLYAAVALASALSVVVLTSVIGDVRWVSPPPVAMHGEQLDVNERQTAPRASEAATFELRSAPPSPAPAPADASRDGAAVLESPPASTPEPRANPEAEARRAGTPTARSERAKPRRRKHGPSAPVSRPNDALDDGAGEPPMRAGAERSSRVRLVEGKLVTNRSPAEATDPPAREPERAPLPEWLELMRRDTDEP
jgi:serine/threonine protein kinase